MLSGHRKNYETHSLGLYEWDFETRKMNVLLEQMDIGFTSYNMNIKENCIYIGADGNEISNGGSLYQFNMTTKELSQVWSVENFGRIELGDSIAFMTAWNAEGKTMIRAMDYEGNVLLDSVLSVEDLGNDSGYGRVFCGGNQDVGYYELQGRDGFITIRVPVSGQGKAQILWKGKGLT